MRRYKPRQARYFHPNGFFAGVGVTFVDQDVVRTDIAKEQSGFSDGGDEFFVVEVDEVVVVEVVVVVVVVFVVGLATPFMQIFC